MPEFTLQAQPRSEDRYVLRGCLSGQELKRCQSQEKRSWRWFFRGGARVKSSNSHCEVISRWCAELHRLRAVFLAAMFADEANIQASLRAAIRIAKEQKWISLEKRAEEPTRSTVAKKRAGQEDVDFEYLFGNVPAAP